MNTEKLKQGKPIKLDNKYNISLISENDINEIANMIVSSDFHGLIEHNSLPDEVIRGFFQSAAKDTKNAIMSKETPTEIKIIIRDENGLFMGMSAVNIFDMMNQGVYEIGFLLPKHAWKKGIATQTCKFLIDFAFKELSAHKIVALCFDNNVGAKKVLEKNGFIQEGVQKGYHKTKTNLKDRIIYGMTPEEHSFV